MSAYAMTNNDAGRFDEPEVHEFYCWSPDNADGTPRTEWYVLDAADDHAVFGPNTIDACLKTAARMNRELGLA